MFKHIASFTAVALLFMATSTATADIFFEVESDTDPILAGGSGTLIVSVTADTAAEQALSFDAYQIGFSVTGFGDATVGDITINPAADLLGFSSNFFDLTGGNFGVIGSGAPAVDLSVTRDLFSIDFDVTGGSVGGFNIDVTSVTDPISNQVVTPDIFFSNAGLDASFGASPEGRISFSSVPEPASTLILLSASTILLLLRRRS